MSRAGLSMVEAVVGLLVASLAALAGVAMIRFSGADAETAYKRGDTRALMDVVTDRLLRDWRFRTATGVAPFPVPLPLADPNAFAPSSGCGDLVIRQRDAAGVVRSVGYRTRCRPGTPPQASARVHPQSGCPGLTEVVRETYNFPNEALPLESLVFPPRNLTQVSFGICWRAVGTELVGEMGAVYGVGPRGRSSFNKIFLSLNDLPPGIEIRP